MNWAEIDVIKMQDLDALLALGLMGCVMYIQKDGSSLGKSELACVGVWSASLSLSESMSRVGQTGHSTVYG